MSMYFIGIDISKYKHDCCIISAADQKVVSKVTIKNNKSGFDELLTIINSLSNPEDIRIGFESTAHYALNLELFLVITFFSNQKRSYRKCKTTLSDHITFTVTLYYYIVIISIAKLFYSSGDTTTTVYFTDLQPSPLEIVNVVLPSFL